MLQKVFPSTTPPPLAVEELRLENHKVITTDGYVLTLNRVLVSGRKKPHPNGVLPPVLICHGLICQGSHWLLNTEDKCLPYILGKSGYDCWLANLRGTQHSKGHETLDTNSQQFWDFSWDDMARFDIPSIIDHILKETRSPQCHYIGHSMGCLILFSSISMQPQYSQKIKNIVALAPSIYARHISNIFLKGFIAFGYSVSQMRTMYARQVPSERMTVSNHVGLICPSFIVGAEKVGALILSTLGVRFGMFGNKQVEYYRMGQISTNWPSTTSFKTILQMAQLYTRNNIIPTQYDYGKTGNLKQYGEEKPPPYDFSRVKNPILVFSSDGDELCTPKDVEEAVNYLPNVVEHVHIADQTFSHIDFMLGNDAPTLIFLPILTHLQEADGGRDSFVENS